MLLFFSSCSCSMACRLFFMVIVSIFLFVMIFIGVLMNNCAGFRILCILVVFCMILGLVILWWVFLRLKVVSSVFGVFCRIVLLVNFVCVTLLFSRLLMFFCSSSCGISMRASFGFRLRWFLFGVVFCAILFSCSVVAIRVGLFVIIWFILGFVGCSSCSVFISAFTFVVVSSFGNCSMVVLSFCMWVLFLILRRCVRLCCESCCVVCYF